MSHTQKEGIDGAPFVVKTFQLVSDPVTNGTVSWSETKDSFIVWKPVDFASDVLPQYFKHNNFCSFIRQLNTYGFHKVDGKQWEFKHDLFREGHSHILKDIQRRKSKKRTNEKEDHVDMTPQTPHVQQTTPMLPQTPMVPQTPSPVIQKEDSGNNLTAIITQQQQQQQNKKMTIKSEPNPEKEIEVEKLKELNSLLMREVIRLQQQQETTQDTINQILEQLMESRKETHVLHKKMAKFSSEVSNHLPNPVGLISPPMSPAHNVTSNNVIDDKINNHLFSPPLFVNTNSPASVSYDFNNIKVANGNNGGFPFTLGDQKVNETFDMNTLDTLLSDENLATYGNLDLNSSIDLELAKMLQNTLSPPQSPANHSF